MYGGWELRDRERRAGVLNGSEVVCGDVQGVAHQAVDDLSQKHSRELKKAKR
jgi:hypothetical protein